MGVYVRLSHARIGSQQMSIASYGFDLRAANGLGFFSTKVQTVSRCMTLSLLECKRSAEMLEQFWQPLRNFGLTQEYIESARPASPTGIHSAVTCE